MTHPEPATGGPVEKTDPAKSEVAPARPYDVRAGILWVLVSAITFALVNVTAKYLAETYNPGQVVWARFFLQLVILAIMLGPRALPALVSHRPGLQVLRSLAMATCTGLYFYGVSFLPIADITAVLFSAPLIVTALSVPILREPVGARRWTAVIIGFGGVLMIVQPEGELGGLRVLIPIIAAFALAFYHLLTRMVSSADSTITSTIYTTLIGAVLFSLYVPNVWQAPDLEGWILLLFIGSVGTLGHFALIRAMGLAPAAVVSAFAYSTLLFTALGGIILFNEIPDVMTITGAAVMVGSGLYVYHRERIARARARA